MYSFALENYNVPLRFTVCAPFKKVPFPQTPQRATSNATDESVTSPETPCSDLGPED